MVEPDTLVLTQVCETVPEVLPVVRPTLVTACPTTAEPSLVILKISTPFQVKELTAGRAIVPRAVVTAGPLG